MEQQMIMNRNNSYVEILEILKYMDKIYIDKIPQKLIQFFEENKAKDYEFEYNSTLELDKQNLNDNTLALLAMLNLNYWCENEEHKKELISKYNENEKKYQEELREKSNPDDIFKNRQQVKNISKENTENIVDMVEYNEPIFKRIINKIKSILHMN